MKIGDRYTLPCNHKGEIVSIFENTIAVKTILWKGHCEHCSAKRETGFIANISLIELNTLPSLQKINKKQLIDSKTPIIRVKPVNLEKIK